MRRPQRAFRPYEWKKVRKARFSSKKRRAPLVPLGRGKLEICPESAERQRQLKIAREIQRENARQNTRYPASIPEAELREDRTPSTAGGGGRA